MGSRWSNTSCLSLVCKILWQLFLKWGVNTSYMSSSALKWAVASQTWTFTTRPGKKQSCLLHVPDWGFRHRDMEQVFEGHTRTLKGSCSFLLSKPTIFLGDPSSPSLEDVLSLQAQEAKRSEWILLGTGTWLQALFCTENTQLSVVCGYLSNYCNNEIN